MLELAHASHTLVKTSAAGGLHLSPMLMAVGSLAILALIALVYVLGGIRVSYARRGQPVPANYLPSEPVSAGAGPDPHVEY